MLIRRAPHVRDFVAKDRQGVATKSVQEPANLLRGVRGPGEVCGDAALPEA